MKIIEENKILQLFNEGKTNGQIAKELDYNVVTVYKHLIKMGIKKFNIKHPPIKIINDTHAECRYCKEIKEISFFQFGRKGTDKEYRYAKCNECLSIRVKSGRSILNTYLHNKFSSLKFTANKNNIPFNITIDDFINQYKAQNGLCFYTDKIMTFLPGKGINKDAISCDKIIPEKGYVKGNIVFCLYKVNTIKSNLDLEQIKAWMNPFYIRIERFINNE